MKTLCFEKVIYINHKVVSKQVIAVWSDITLRTARIICQNFFDGFHLALNKDHRIPVHPSLDGYTISSWNLHKDGTGWQYRFVNGKNRIIRFN